MSSLNEVRRMLSYSLRCKQVRHGAVSILIAAVICLLIGLAWWGPAKFQHAQLSKKIDLKHLATVEAMRSYQVASAHREASQVLDKFEKKLDARTGQADLIRGIARLSAKRGVRVTSQSFDEGREQSGDTALYLELGLLGDYVSLRKLMSDFAALPIWIEVMEARLERSDEGGRLVKAQLRLLTFRMAKGPQ